MKLLLPYTPEQSQQAYDEWKAMCGHHSIAAAAYASLDRVKQACPKLVGWMNPTMMGTTLHNLGARTTCMTRLPEDTLFLFTPGRRILRVQFDGRWTGPGVPPAAAYKYTHYIAVIDGQVMDPMIDDSLLVPLRDWLETEQDRVLQDIPKSTGWHFTHCWEVEPLPPTWEDYERLRNHIADLEFARESNEPWQEKAQQMLDGGRWAGCTYMEGCVTELEEARQALRAIKLTALTATDGAKGLSHITRLCIDAGVKEKLDELQKLKLTGK